MADDVGVAIVLGVGLMVDVGVDLDIVDIAWGVGVKICGIEVLGILGDGVDGFDLLRLRLRRRLRELV